MPKSIPQLGDSNWGTPLNAHLAQLQNPANGAINSFDQFLGRPTNLTLDDAGKTYLYTQTGNIHQWNGNTWKVLNESVINVKDYGAVGDGTDATTQIQFCLDKAALTKGTVYIPNGGYAISKPLEVSSFTTLYGESIRGTTLSKNTTTTGIGGFNAVIILKKDVDGYNNYSNLQNFLIATDINIDYGIVCENGSAYLKMTNLYFYKLKTGFKSNDSFMTNVANCRFDETGTGLKILAGTSLVASDNYCNGGSVGFWLTNLTYSTLNSCGVDGITSVSYRMTGCRGITLNSCGSEIFEGRIEAENKCMFYADNSFVTINAPFVIVDYGIMDKGICHALNNSRVLINNLCIDQVDSKFLIAESNSIITIDEINNTNLGVPAPFIKSDKYVEASGGKILSPNKNSAMVNYSSQVKSVNYNSTYPTGNNDYNENLNLNLTNEINNLVGVNWIKARITFQGNDFTNTSGYVVIDAFQTNTKKSYVLGSVNAGVTLVGDVLKIPTIAVAGGGHWYKMQGIYEVTVSI
jgi:hypothetical protein